MAYKRLEFKNRSVERPRTYLVTENPDGSITLRDSFGQTYVEGTPLDAANMNYLEDGIAACGLTKYAATTTYDKNELVVDGATGKIYVSQVGNNKGTPLTNTSYWKLLVTGTLETARKINGTDFDGSKDITTANWGTARNISITSSDGTGAGTATSVNGSAAVTLKLPSTIKATLNGNVTGNATNDGSGNNIVNTYQQKSTAVTHTANTAVGSSTRPVYVNSSGSAVAISSYEGNAASATKATNVNNSRDNGSLKLWTGTLAQYNAISNKDNNTLYNITDDTDTTLTLLQTIYPVGSLYMTTSNSCPLSTLFGTWQKIEGGRALWISDNSHAPNTTIEAGLPNITGYLPRENYVRAAVKTGNYGAFVIPARSSGWGRPTSENSGYWWHTFEFDASKSNPIYSNSDTVQPPAYVVNVFRRIA